MMIVDLWSERITQSAFTVTEHIEEDRAPKAGGCLVKVFFTIQSIGMQWVTQQREQQMIKGDITHHHIV